ncbi:hypothetical protein BJY04DRAFT_208172 [Aspergillus karnatakaensis]|uniref:uncharacterized protein n=1 Tax=Aspergillus karnatakaensis TaxID=1810916 RepID=UPI003CCD62C1
MSSCKPYDDVAWAIRTQIWQDWPELLRTDGDIYNDIGVILSKQLKDLDWTAFGFLSTGGFNICFKMEFANDSGAIIRFPVPDAVMLPKEKVRNEVSVMKFILDKTSSTIPIPVPSITRFADAKESPSNLGPFIIMIYIRHTHSMADFLERPNRPGGQQPVLNPDLEPARLQSLYGDLARIVLSLSKLENDIWDVLHRPLSYSMNEIRKEANVPLAINPEQLADHFRRRFVARFLFRKIVRDQEQRKQWIHHDDGPFPLWLDWEFSYSAPAEFSYAPPWWLLLRKPEDWPGGLDDWCIEYKKALRVFLSAMQRCEDELIQKKLLRESERLSFRMLDSWRTGDFWIMYAARNNFPFDAIYWKRIDRRLHLLEHEVKELMEEWVSQMVRDRDTWQLSWDPDEYTLEWIEKLKMKRAGEEEEP